MMKPNIRHLRLYLLISFSALLLAFLWSPGNSKAYADSQNSSEVVSDCSTQEGVSPCQTETFIPESYFAVWGSQASNQHVVTVNFSYTCDSGDEGFQLVVDNGGSGTPADYSNGCINQPIGSNHSGSLSFTMGGSNGSCTQAQDGNDSLPYCYAQIALKAINPGANNNGYTGGHVSVSLTVGNYDNSVDVYPDSSTSPNIDPSDGQNGVHNWGDVAGANSNEFGEYGGKSYTFQVPCNYNGGKVYIAWAGDDPSLNPGGTFTLSGPGITTPYTPSPQKIGSDGNSKVYAYGFNVVKGGVYTWNWNNIDPGNEIAYSVPFSLNAAAKDITCSPPTPTWNLKGVSTVDKSSLTNNTSTATFTHTITNTGADTATYNWYIQGEYNGNNTSSWTGSDCSVNAGVANAGDACPLASKTGVTAVANGTNPNTWTIHYKFPSSASPGDTYCQRIYYTNASGPASAAEASNNNTGDGVCVKYQPTNKNQNSGSACSWLGVDYDNNDEATPSNSPSYDGQTFPSTKDTVYIGMKFANTGTTTWDANSYGIRYIGGSINPLKNAVGSGDSYTIYGDNNAGTLAFIHNGNNPSGVYQFQMSNASGSLFGSVCSVTISWQTPNPNVYKNVCTTSTVTTPAKHTNPASTYMRTEETVVDSSGNTLIAPFSTANDPVSNNNTGTSATATYNWWPRGANITVTIQNQYRNNKIWYPDGAADTYTIPCFSATCQITAITPTTADPSDIVIAGSQVKVNAIITNTSSYNDGQNAWNMPLDDVHGNTGLGLYGTGGAHPPDGWTGAAYNYLLAGQSAPVTFYVTAPNAITTGVITEAPSFSDFALGGVCSGASSTYSVYQPFSLSVNSSSTFGGSDENPPSWDYNTTVTEAQESNAAVDVPTYSSVYATTAAAGTQYQYNGFYDGGAFSSGLNYVTNQSAAGVYRPLNAGDQYCADISTTGDVTGTTSGGGISGYVGPGGPGDTKDVSGSMAVHNCVGVINEPTFKVKNSGIVSCQSGTDTDSAIAGWNDDSGAYPGVGSGAERVVVSLLSNGITGVSSGQNTASFNTGVVPPGTGLTAANAGTNVINDGTTAGQDSPILGGQSGIDTACPSYSPPNGTTDSSSTNDSVDALKPADLTNKTTVNQSYGYNTAGGLNLTLGGGTVSPNENVNLYVKGNVYIDGNITYAGDSGGNGGLGPTWTDASRIPSFNIHASGNIYIAPGVTELDGLYTAQVNATNTGGNIYTCADTPDGNYFAPMPASELYSNCNQQLVVYGSFQAKQIDLMRTLGSLRDDTSNSAGAVNCSNSGSTAQYSCAGEVFQYSPEMYVSDPTISGVSSTTTTPDPKPEVESYTNLPPVL